VSVKKPAKRKTTKRRAGAPSSTPRRENPVRETKPFPPPDIAAPSICVKCAKHPSLQRFIRDHGKKGHRCGICHRTDQTASHPSEFESLSSLVRALVRYFYDEPAYNSHFGGDCEPEGLLCRENDIVEHKAVRGFPRSAEASEELRVSLFDPPYPDYDKGISVYAGYSDGHQLPLLHAISTINSSLYANIEDRLSKENYFEVQKAFRKYLAQIDSGLSTTIRPGSLYFRARIGIAKRFYHSPGLYDGEIRFQPYMGADIGAPPPPLASAGRLNRVGVSFLYLASDQSTAAAEIRPHPGHLVSLASFRAVKEIRIADFGALDIADFSASDARLDIFHLGWTISKEISLPIVPEDRHKYSVTQLLADILRKQGYEGIRFPSSVAPGTNLCVFKPGLFREVQRQGMVLGVAGLHYKMRKRKHVIKPAPGDFDLGR